MIKEHIDSKFIKNKNGSNKGINQIIEQLKIISNNKYEFDDIIPKNLIVYPLIIHTNFTYQLPGVNYYLQNQFYNKVQSELPDIQIQIEELILIDLETIFEFLMSNEIDLDIFEAFLNSYNSILKNREMEFLSNPNQERFVKSKASFDEIFKTIFYKEITYQDRSKIVNILLETIGADEELLNAF